MTPKCPHYRARSPTDRACVDFFDEHPELTGACWRDDMFMCVEWLRVYEGVVDAEGLVQIRKKPKRPPPSAGTNSVPVWETVLIRAGRAR